MRSAKQSPSGKAVSSVTSFVAGKHLHGKPRPSTLELMLESRKIDRLMKNYKEGHGTGHPRKRSAVTTLFSKTWDTFIAHVMTALFASLRIFLFFLFAGLLLMALLTILHYQ